MRLVLAALSAAFFLAPSVAFSDGPQGKKLSWFGEISGGLGGDTLATLYFVDGEKQDLDAGDGVTLSIGAAQHFSRNFGVKYAVGYKMSFSAAENLDVRKSTIPIDIIPYLRSGQHRFGAGLTYHLSPEFYMESYGTVEFDSATGYVVEYGFAGFTLAYTDIDYSVEGVDFDASNIGLRYTFGF